MLKHFTAQQEKNIADGDAKLEVLLISHTFKLKNTINLCAV